MGDPRILDLLARVGELERRLANMILRGRVSAVDHAARKARVAYGTKEKPQETGWLSWTPMRAGKAVMWWPTEVGEAVMVVSESGEPTLGVIYPAAYSDACPAPSDNPDLFHIAFGDEAVLQYDRATHELKAVLPDGGRAEVKAPVEVKLDTAKLYVTGDIKADGEITDHTRSMQADRDIYNGHNHPGVQSGNGKTATTEAKQ